MVMHKKATKANALAALAEYWDIDKSVIVAFDDDINDIDMLSYVLFDTKLNLSLYC